MAGHYQIGVASMLADAQEQDLEGKHLMRIMDPEVGDTKVIYDPDNEDEVANARETFKRMKAKGLVAYSVKKNGDQAGVMQEFDPEAKAIIFSAPIKGG